MIFEIALSISLTVFRESFNAGSLECCPLQISKFEFIKSKALLMVLLNNNGESNLA